MTTQQKLIAKSTSPTQHNRYVRYDRAHHGRATKHIRVNMFLTPRLANLGFKVGPACRAGTSAHRPRFWPAALTPGYP
jgi:hypothetical protein